MILVSSCCVMFLHRNHQHLSRRSPSPTMRFHKCVKAVYNRSAVLHAVFCRTHRHRHRHRHRLCGVRCSVCEEPAWALCSASGIKGLRLGAWAWGLGLMVLHMDFLPSLRSLWLWHVIESGMCLQGRWVLFLPPPLPQDLRGIGKWNGSPHHVKAVH